MPLIHKTYVTSVYLFFQTLSNPISYNFSFKNYNLSNRSYIFFTSIISELIISIVHHRRWKKNFHFFPPVPQFMKLISLDQIHTHALFIESYACLCGRAFNLERIAKLHSPYPIVERTMIKYENDIPESRTMLDQFLRRILALCLNYHR